MLIGWTVVPSCMISFVPIGCGVCLYRHSSPVLPRVHFVTVVASMALQRVLIGIREDI